MSRQLKTNASTVWGDSVMEISSTPERIPYVPPITPEELARRNAEAIRVLDSFSGGGEEEAQDQRETLDVIRKALGPERIASYWSQFPELPGSGESQRKRPGIMVELLPKLKLWGEQFSPRAAEEVTCLSLSDKSEPGQLGVRGKYKGLPQPGSADLEAPANIEEDARVAWIAEAAAPHMATLRHLGVTACHLHVNVLYWDQCNLCFRPRDLALLAALGVNFTVSCYKQDSEDDPVR